MASVLAGVAVGAILGIIFAPDRGIETRRKIAKKGSDFAGTVKDKYNDFAGVISDEYDVAKQKLSRLVSERNSIGEDLVHEATDKADAIKSDVKNSGDTESLIKT